MDFANDIATTILGQLQQPTLAFLIGGMMLAALGSRIEVPDAIYKFIVVVLLLKVGMSAGISVREANLMELAVPALLAAVLGILIIFLGRATLARWRGVSEVDGMATAGLFGAVSASTLAAGMAMLDDRGIAYEGFIGALYPFMDIAALVTAIVLARMSAERKAARGLQGGGAATMTMGGRHGRLRRRHGARHPRRHGAEPGDLGAPPRARHRHLRAARQRLRKLLRAPLPRAPVGPDARHGDRGLAAARRSAEGRPCLCPLRDRGRPFVHGALGFGAGLIAHHLTGFSAGGVVLLAVMAASSSDISGPPTLRGALPEANPSAYVGTSTGLGTPVAILSIPVWIALAEAVIGL
jgi:uncharacterized protein